MMNLTLQRLSIAIISSASLLSISYSFSPSSCNRRQLSSFLSLSLENDNGDGDDWRAFRAKLIQKENEGSTSSSDGRTSWTFDTGLLIEKGSIVISRVEDSLGCHDLRQPYFCKCVVLIVEHDNEFTQGIILNRPSNLNFNDQDIVYLDDDGSELFSTATPSSSGDDEDVEEDENSNWRMFFGGDIANVYEENPLIVCLHNNTSELAQSVSDTVLPGVYLTSHLGARSLIYSGEASEGDFYSFFGFCGWDPGQLEREVKRGSWYMVSADSQTIWNELKTLRNPRNDPRMVGLDMWSGIIKAIREDELPTETNTFADLMLKEWATKMLMVAKDEEEVVAEIDDADIYRALQAAEQQPSIQPGALLRGSSKDTSPFLLQDQFLHKSIVLILQDSESVSVGLVLNLPTTDTYTIDINGSAVTFPIRYGGPGGEEREEDPLIWLHNHQSLKAMGIGKSLNGEDPDCIWTCSLDDVINSIESDSATAKDFILVKGFCVWQKEAYSAGGIKGQVLAGNFEAPVITSKTNNDDVWSCLTAQDQLSEDSLSRNFQFSFDAWSAAGNIQTDQQKDGSKSAEDCRTVFGSDVRVSILCDEALLNWVKIFLLGNAEYYR